MNQDELKKMAGKWSSKYIEDGMTVGLGTGTTVKFLVDAIAERLNNKTLKSIRAVCTSSRTAN